MKLLRGQVMQPAIDRQLANIPRMVNQFKVGLTDILEGARAGEMENEGWHIPLKHKRGIYQWHIETV
jgi:hypothetical protein